MATYVCILSIPNTTTSTSRFSRHAQPSSYSSNSGSQRTTGGCCITWRRGWEKKRGSPLLRWWRGGEDLGPRRILSVTWLRMLHVRPPDERTINRDGWSIRWFTGLDRLIISRIFRSLWRGFQIPSLCTVEFHEICTKKWRLLNRWWYLIWNRVRFPLTNRQSVRIPLYTNLIGSAIDCDKPPVHYSVDQTCDLVVWTILPNANVDC